jgi:dTDP-4-dehydrorhamnose 3,5-epimerase
MRFLVTGGGGQLGRAFAKLYPQAVVLGKSELDITDPASVEAALDRGQPEVLVNAAGFTAVDAAEAHPEEAARVNVEAVIQLAQAAKRAGATLVQISTDYVFPGDKPGAYTENDRTRPLSVYGRTKLQSEMAARAAGGKSLIVRTSWVFGEGKNFISSVLNAAQGRDSLDVVDDQRGRPTSAEDLAAAIVTLVDKGSTGLYHVTGGGEVGSWADVAETAIEAAGLPTTVRRVTTAQYYAGKAGPVATRPANSELDCSLAASAGVKLRPWPEAVTAYVRKKLESN